MISGEMDRLHPSARVLVRNRVASRIREKDATLYGFDSEAQSCAENFMGWVGLADDPPTGIDEIEAFAKEVAADGFDAVVLIGQGGSTQAPMTITKYNKDDSKGLKFIVIDSDSPVRVRELLVTTAHDKCLFIISSKSGGTIEPRKMLVVLRRVLGEHLSQEEISSRLVAITDPGSALEEQALREGWRKVFRGEPSVGGRFSALSVFGLVPAVLAGIDIRRALEHARMAERLCSEDAIDNPAVGLAAFLYDNYLDGRNKFCFLTPKRGRVLGLWIEQLVAESLGKDGKGILPNIEIDTLLLSEDPGDRSVILYETKTDLWDERKNFEMSFAYLDPRIPRLSYRIDSVEELAEHFVMWEYAIAMCGYLMEVCPFDQPDVASVKARVLEILRDGSPEPDFCERFIGDVNMGEVEVRYAPCIMNAYEGESGFAGLEKLAAKVLGDSESEAAGGEPENLEAVLRALFGSIRPGDYFALNAFLPFTGEYRREALEAIRHDVAQGCGVVSCLEVGPRYLHSTGQLQKGGANNGVFLVLSADELKDIPVDDEVESLGSLAKAQAVGDMMTLAERGRRCVHLHLPDNSGVTLRALSQLVSRVLSPFGA